MVGKILLPLPGEMSAQFSKNENAEMAKENILILTSRIPTLGNTSEQSRINTAIWLRTALRVYRNSRAAYSRRITSRLTFPATCKTNSHVRRHSRRDRQYESAGHGSQTQRAYLGGITGTTFAGTLRFTRAWVNHNGCWQLAALQNGLTKGGH